MTKMKSFLKCKIGRVVTIVIITILITIQMNNYCYATVEEVSGGGSIQNSKIGTGIMKMIKDLTGTLQWIIPVVGVMVILYYIFKIMTRR